MIALVKIISFVFALILISPIRSVVKSRPYCNHIVEMLFDDESWKHLRLIWSYFSNDQGFVTNSHQFVSIIQVDWAENSIDSGQCNGRQSWFGWWGSNIKDLVNENRYHAECDRTWSCVVQLFEPIKTYIRMRALIAEGPTVVSLSWLFDSCCIYWRIALTSSLSAS